MKRLLTFLVCFYIFLPFNSMCILSIDSTETDEISFVNMEAIISSKIIHFKWAVDTELNGDYFIIEKSIDKVFWYFVSRVESIENHEDQHTYEISAINFAEDHTEYFRIQRVNQKGERTFLDEIDVSRPVLSNMLILMVPGKTNKLINVSYDSFVKSSGEMIVINEFGEEVFTKKLNVIDGYNRLLLNISSFDKGRYSVIVKDNYGNRTSRPLVIYKNKGKKKRR